MIMTNGNHMQVFFSELLSLVRSDIMSAREYALSELLRLGDDVKKSVEHLKHRQDEAVARVLDISAGAEVLSSLGGLDGAMRIGKELHLEREKTLELQNELAVSNSER